MNRELNQMVKKLIVMIPARIGSKGIPQKVTRPFNGQPLIFSAINVALSIPDAHVFVNTDSKKIETIVKKKYADSVNVYFRPDDLGLDDVTLDLLALNFVKENDFTNDILVTIQPTSPLLRYETLVNILDVFQANELSTVLTVVESKKLEWELGTNGLFIKKYKSRLNRQQLDASYTETGAVVICDTSVLVKHQSRFGDSIICVPVSKEESIDIDDYSDWILAQALANGREILFMTLANKKVGSGHFHRTISLANCFPDYLVEFILFDTDDEWLDYLNSLNYSNTSVSSRSKAFDLATTINPSLVVLDILNTTEEEIALVRDISSAVNVISFEDLGTGSLKTDLTINELYPPVNDECEHILSGPRFCFFRDEFLDLKVMPRHLRENDIVISFGGTDPNDLTLRILRVLDDYEQRLKIRVIVGLGATRLVGEIKKHASESRHLIDFSDLNGEIAGEWMNAKLGICGGGRTVYEFAVCDTQTIVLCQNSRELTHLYSSKVNGIDNLGLHSEVHDSDIHNAIMSVDFSGESSIQPSIGTITPNNTNKNVIKVIRDILGENNV